MVSQRATRKDVKAKLQGDDVDTLDELNGLSVDDLEIEDEFEPVNIDVSRGWILGMGIEIQSGCPERFGSDIDLDGCSMLLWHRQV